MGDEFVDIWFELSYYVMGLVSVEDCIFDFDLFVGGVFIINFVLGIIIFFFVSDFIFLFYFDNVDFCYVFGFFLFEDVLVFLDNLII